MIYRRLWAVGRPLSRTHQPRIFTRCASSSQVSDSDLEAFHSFLESHPSAAQLKLYQSSPAFKDIAKHLKAEGSTESDVQALLRPASVDPEMVGTLSSFRSDGYCLSCGSQAFANWVLEWRLRKSSSHHSITTRSIWRLVG